MVAHELAIETAVGCSDGSPAARSRAQRVIRETVR